MNNRSRQIKRAYRHSHACREAYLANIERMQDADIGDVFSRCCDGDLWESEMADEIEFINRIYEDMRDEFFESIFGKSA